MKRQFNVYDKIKWHTEKKMSFNDAQKHIKIIMYFLMEKHMLSAEGIDIFLNDGITEDFSLNSDLLTEEGDFFLSKHYKFYLKNFENHPIKDVIDLLEKKIKSDEN